MSRAEHTGTHLLVDERPEIAALLGSERAEVARGLRAACLRGARPGNVAVGLTDPHNLGRFYDDPAQVAAMRAQINPAPGEEVRLTLLRKLGELTARVHQLCPACAAFLRAVPPRRIPVCILFGEARLVMAVGSMAWPTTVEVAPRGGEA